MTKATGTSNKGDLQEAINAAVASAHETSGSTLVKWQLEGIAGEHGGFAGQNELSATISY